MNLNENVKMPSKKNYIIVSEHFVPVDELYSFCRVTRSDENCHAKTIELKTKNYACPALLVSVFLICRILIEPCTGTVGTYLYTD